MPSIRIISFADLNSTSTHARCLIEARPPAVPSEPFLVTAATQSAGRGQFSRAWSSPRGGLWCTLAWPTPISPIPPDSLQSLGLRVGLACLHTIDDALPHLNPRAELKWPNDIYIRARKILGVLTEVVRPSAHAAHAIPPSWILVGVGINANFFTDDLPPEVAARATTLLQVTGTPIDLTNLRDTLVSHLAAALSTPTLTNAMLAEARARLHGLGADADIRDADGNHARGVLLGLDDDGNPRIKNASGVVTARALLP